MEAVATPSASARRRRPRKGDLKEQAILDSFEQLLSERSLEEIGIDELAQRAGISRPTFYFYFESKHALLRALAERVADQAYRASEWLSGSGEPPEAIRRSIAASARLWREHGPVLRAAVQASGSVPELRRFWEQTIAGFVEASAAQIKRERRAGIAPDRSPSAKALATALIWMNERCFYTASLGANPSLTERELVNTLTTIWLRAVYGSDEPAGPKAPAQAT